MHSVEGLLLNKSCQRLHTKRKFPDSQGTLSGQRTLLQTGQVLGHQILRAVDDSEVLRASALNSGLQDFSLPSGYEGIGLHNHSFSTGTGEIKPPLHSVIYAVLIGSINADVVGCHEDGIDIGAVLLELLHMPYMLLLGEYMALAGKQMERSNLRIINRIDRPAVLAVCIYVTINSSLLGSESLK